MFTHGTQEQIISAKREVARLRGKQQGRRETQDCVTIVKNNGNPRRLYQKTKQLTALRCKKSDERSKG
jgi:hypothetical protein